MHFRQLLATWLLIAPLSVAAQAYPAKPIRLVVPFPPGGATDILSRELARQMSDRLKQQVVVDNRPGAGGTLGSDIVAKSAPDGYTIQMATSSTHSIGPGLNPKIPYNAQNDFTPVAHVANAVNVLLVAPNVKASNVAELTALLKSRPGQYNYGSSGNGTIVHLTSELFKSMTDTYVVHIPYRGTALVIPDMMSGQIHLLFDSIASAMPHIKDGKLRAMAVTSIKRSPLLPALPAVSDSVPGFESVTCPQGNAARDALRPGGKPQARHALPDAEPRVREVRARGGGDLPRLQPPHRPELPRPPVPRVLRGQPRHHRGDHEAGLFHRGRR